MVVYFFGQFRDKKKTEIRKQSDYGTIRIAVFFFDFNPCLIFLVGFTKNKLKKLIMPFRTAITHTMNEETENP